jgi:hypothetical protein
LSGSQTISQELLQRLQCAGWAKVSASSHSCDSLLHWAVAWEMTSSDRQLEQTGVDRLARRMKILAGSVFELNGLRSDGCVISCPDTSAADSSASMMHVSALLLVVLVAL